jgi:hypothetical protein
VEVCGVGQLLGDGHQATPRQVGQHLHLLNQPANSQIRVQTLSLDFVTGPGPVHFSKFLSSPLNTVNIYKIRTCQQQIKEFNLNLHDHFRKTFYHIYYSDPNKTLPSRPA